VDQIVNESFSLVFCIASQSILNRLPGRRSAQH
jgi:hypothetical protein